MLDQLAGAGRDIEENVDAPGDSPMIDGSIDFAGAGHDIEENVDAPGDSVAAPIAGACAAPCYDDVTVAANNYDDADDGCA